MQDIFCNRERRDVEPSGRVDVHGVDIGSLQALNLLDRSNQKPVFQKGRPEPRAVHTCHVHPDPELGERDTLTLSMPISHTVSSKQEPPSPYRLAAFATWSQTAFAIEAR